jgi:hypothetical protein
MRHETTFAWFLGANGYFSFIGCNFFQVFIQYATYHPYTANVLCQPFIHILQHFFSIFHCQMLHDLEKHYKMDEVLCTFTDFSLNNLVEGLLFCPLGTTSFRKLLKVTSSISSVHISNCFEKKFYPRPLR